MASKASGSKDGGGSFRWAVDASSKTAASEQLRALILSGVESGQLATGTPLPPVRRLAEQLGLAPNTVAKVYRELERDEVVLTAGRNGTSIAPTGDGPRRQAQVAALVYAERIRQLGVDEEAAVALLRDALRVRGRA